MRTMPTAPSSMKMPPMASSATARSSRIGVLRTRQRGLLDVARESDGAEETDKREDDAGVEVFRLAGGDGIGADDAQDGHGHQVERDHAVRTRRAHHQAVECQEQRGY